MVNNMKNLFFILVKNKYVQVFYSYKFMYVCMVIYLTGRIEWLTSKDNGITVQSKKPLLSDYILFVAVYMFTRNGIS